MEKGCGGRKACSGSKTQTCFGPDVLFLCNFYVRYWKAIDASTHLLASLLCSISKERIESSVSGTLHSPP
ncbi:hypothetical protein GJ744_011135 [Endocarpon pusillum]|uniref:Uncharacterized protein n=1 Tax=Endocarpon pusillum TaxID=364733 RepID=A0A8H7AF24_9EURO|nr:hypothetical protein GJ744_011135 [Endocarpon pusillum]